MGLQITEASSQAHKARLAAYRFEIESRDPGYRYDIVRTMDKDLVASRGRLTAEGWRYQLSIVGIPLSIILGVLSIRAAVCWDSIWAAGFIPSFVVLIFSLTGFCWYRTDHVLRDGLSRERQFALDCALGKHRPGDPLTASQQAMLGTSRFRRRYAWHRRVYERRLRRREIELMAEIDAQRPAGVLPRLDSEGRPASTTLSLAASLSGADSYGDLPGAAREVIVRVEALAAPFAARPFDPRAFVFSEALRRYVPDTVAAYRNAASVGKPDVEAELLEQLRIIEKVVTDAAAGLAFDAIAAFEGNRRFLQRMSCESRTGVLSS